MTRERAAELLSEVMVLDDPEMAEAHRVAISAIRQQDVADKDVGKNEPLTNVQKIRAMNDEELAEFIKHIKVRAAFCKAVKDNDAFEALCSAEWLQMPAEEDDRDERKENENV